MSVENFKTVVKGHVLIQDKDTGETLMDKSNAIHPQNMARALARGLANEPNGYIYQLVLGNGGTTLNPDLTINFLTPNTVGESATLYNQTYEEIVDDTNVGVGVGNSVISAPSTLPAITSVVTITTELSAAEPAGQALSDIETGDINSDFTFDELGLVTEDASPLLLSHVIFSPIEKTANRSLLITYTLTISVS